MALQWRLLVMLALAASLAACAMRGPRVQLDEAAWQRATRIELVYVEGSAPRVAYLPDAEAPASRDAGETSAADGGEAPADRCGPASATVAPAASSPIRPRLAAWAWDARAARADPAGFAQRVAAIGLETLFLQVEPELEQQSMLIDALAAAGVRVIALDGYADAASHPQALEQDIALIHRYNARHAAHIAGFQVDVEPYLLPDFRLDAGTVFGQYLAMLARLRAQLGPGLEFSAAIPFWYASERVAGRSLAELVIEATDVVAVMSYRSDRARVAELARPSLCLAARHGRSAWVGLEYTRLASEVHLVLQKSQLGSRVRRQAGGLYLQAGEGLPVAGSYVVKADDLSFHSNPQRLRELLAETLPYASFAGWAVNGLSLGRGDPLLAQPF
jgi:predicted small lipoprotein YifL